jgi:hypothetical protein
MIGEARSDEVPANGASDRSFGIAIAGVLALLGAWPLLGGEPARAPLLFASAGLIGVALVAPQILLLPNRGFARFGQLLQMIVSPLILLILFSLVITPLALLMRLRGRRSRMHASGSFWITRELAINEEFFRRQY